MLPTCSMIHYNSVIPHLECVQVKKTTMLVRLIDVSLGNLRQFLLFCFCSKFLENLCSLTIENSTVNVATSLNFFLVS